MIMNSMDDINSIHIDDGGRGGMTKNYFKKI